MLLDNLNNSFNNGGDVTATAQRFMLWIDTAQIAPNGGWHTNTAYAYARLKSSTSSYSPTLPYAPVKGNCSFIASHETTTDGVSKNITGWMVSVDPKLHADPPSTGLVLGSGTTACAPTVKGSL